MVLSPQAALASCAGRSPRSLSLSVSVCLSLSLSLSGGQALTAPGPRQVGECSPHTSSRGQAEARHPWARARGGAPGLGWALSDGLPSSRLPHGLHESALTELHRLGEEPHKSVFSLSWRPEVKVGGHGAGFCPLSLACGCSDVFSLCPPPVSGSLSPLFFLRTWSHGVRLSHVTSCYPITSLKALSPDSHVCDAGVGMSTCELVSQGDTIQPMKRASFQCLCVLAWGVGTVLFPLDTLAWGGQERRRRRWDASLHQVTFWSCLRPLWWLSGPADLPPCRLPTSPHDGPWGWGFGSFSPATPRAALGAAWDLGGHLALAASPLAAVAERGHSDPLAGPLRPPRPLGELLPVRCTDLLSLQFMR